jgi:hypothetical protein
MRRHVRTVILGTGAMVACFGPGARLSPELAGCYRVEAREWSASHSRVTGFRELPPVIALDTARLGRVLVPTRWRLADPPNYNSASLSLYILPWRWTGDSLIFDRYSSPHPLHSDSVIVAFRGWGGSMTAYLERQGEDLAGYGVFSPLQRPEDVPGIRVRLYRTTCPPDLGEALPPT